MPKAPSMPRRVRRYDWKGILNLKKLPRTFTQGKDYDCRDDSFMLQTRSAARILGKRISIRVEKGSVTIFPKER